MGKIAEPNRGSQLGPIAAKVLVHEAEVVDRARHIIRHRDDVRPDQEIGRTVPVRTKVYRESVVPELHVRWSGKGSARWLVEGLVKRRGTPVTSQLGHKTIGPLLFKWL